MTEKSANDVCFKKGKTLCVMYLTAGEVPTEHVDVLKEMNIKYDRKIKRGASFSFMWLDANEEQEWVGLFKL